MPICRFSDAFLSGERRVFAQLADAPLDDHAADAVVDAAMRGFTS